MPVGFRTPAGRRFQSIHAGRAVALAALFTGLALSAPTASAAVSCPQDLCPSSDKIHGSLADSNGDGEFDSSFQRIRVNDSHVVIRLVAFSGKRIWEFTSPWRAVLPDDDLPSPAVAGEFTSDGINDYVITARGLLTPPSKCGPYDQTWSQPIFIDGKTRELWYPLPSIASKCWDFPHAGVTYPTSRYSGFVQVGDFNTAYKGREVAVIPMYPPDDRGWIFNRYEHGKWTKIKGRNGADSLVFPSHPDFGAHYNSANPGNPCKWPLTFKHCNVPDSHVPTGLALNSQGHRNLFLLTTGRALLYRPDLTPTADTVWSSGDTPNGGRNYGFALSYSAEGRDYVSLIGGCSVKVARNAMTSGTPPGGSLETSLGGVAAHCGIHHHYAWFAVQGSRITNHFNRYYSYSVSDGFFHNRPEYPGNPVGPIGGNGTTWLAYNLFDGEMGSTGKGQWRIELQTDPADPTKVRSVPGWYVWDVVDLNGDGKAELLATRAPGRDAAQPYVLPWEMDVLSWNGTDFESIHHEAGAAPGVFRVPNGPTRAADGGGTRQVTITRDVTSDGVREVMVENADGHRSFLRVPALAP